MYRYALSAKELSGVHFYLLVKAFNISRLYNVIQIYKVVTHALQLIDAARQTKRDVMAYYFILPDKENLAQYHGKHLKSIVKRK